MSLTDKQWEIAHAIAQTLVQEHTDVNEVSKAVAYLRTVIDKGDATSRFLTYLKTLVRDGKMIGHSGKTAGYYRNIEATCSQYFKNNSDASTILQILGWVSRLMKYYNNSGVPIGEITTPTAVVVESARQAEIAKASGSHNFVVGQVVEAIITAIKGVTVTYEIILTKQRLSNDERRKVDSLSEGQKVNVEILKLKEDGSIKKIRLID